MKDGSAEAVKDVILQPSKSPTNLFSRVAQYKDTDDNFIYIELNTLENTHSDTIFGLFKIREKDDSQVKLLQQNIIKSQKFIIKKAIPL